MSEVQADGYPRVVSQGRTFVYVLPCREEDILKVGYSRNPMQRLHALHRRYFRFFDLDRALLLEAESLRDARRIERLFTTQFADDRAPAPLVVRQAAAGQTEWFQGVARQADVMARAIATDEGLTLHAPLRGWLHERLKEHSETLFDCSLRMLDSVEYEQFNVAVHQQDGYAAASLGHLLDLYDELELDLNRLVPPRVLEWYHGWRDEPSGVG